MDFQQIRDFVNPAVAQATGIEPVENLSMQVPVAYVPVQLVIDGALSLTSENPVQNKVIAVAIQNLDGRITAIEGQFSEGVTEAVNDWLDAHPEATTTVQDGAISYAKLDSNLKGKVDDISDLKSALSAGTRNLWPFGDPSFVNKKEYAFNLPAGTYTISAVPTSSDVQSQVCRVRISSTSPLTGGTGILANFNLYRNEKNSYTFTISEDAKSIEFSAGNNDSSSSGDSATFADVQIESGEEATEYIPHITATDFLVRESVIMPFDRNMPVNVLLLGIKNDGSEDVSTKVNTYTALFPLYFPAGIYRVSSQIKLRNSIYGAGVSRFNRVDANYTWFVSDIDNPTTPLTSVFKIESNRTENISGINIMLNSFENGIDIYYTQIYTKINNINISNIRGHGIFGYRSTDQTTGSRLLFIDDVSLFGASDYPSISVGIKFSSQIGDCRILNCEIMGLKVGIEIGNGIIYMANNHIWCGPLAGVDNGTWWAETVGIKCSQGNRLIATNIYLDTCYHAIETIGNGGSIDIQNLIYAEDTSTSGSQSDDSVLLYMVKNLQRIIINGGFVNFRGGQDNPCKLKKFYNLNNPNLKIENVISVGDYAITPGNANKFNQESLKTDYALLLDTTASDKYIEIAHIPKHNINAYAEISFLNENGDTCKLNIKTAGTTVNIESVNNSSTEYYYKYSADSGLILYMKKTISSDEMLNVYAERFSSLFVPANYCLIRRRTPNENNTNEYAREILNSPDGLTLIS